VFCSISAAWRTLSTPLPASEPMLSKPIVGSFLPKTARAKLSPIIANWNKLSPLHSEFAPRSSITLCPLRVGNKLQIAGRSMPGRVRRVSLLIAIKAPVLPPETAASARPSFTALIASCMDDSFLRMAREGFSCASTTTSVWKISDASSSLGSFLSSGSILLISPNIRNLVPG